MTGLSLIEHEQIIKINKQNLESSTAEMSENTIITQQNSLQKDPQPRYKSRTESR